MPTVSDSPEDVVQAIEKQKEGEDQTQLKDPCLENAQEVAPDSKEIEGGMVKTVPYAIAIPSSHESDHGSERFTPVTEHTATPVPPNIPEVEEEEEILIATRPSSAAPSRMRSAGKSKSPTAAVPFQAYRAEPGNKGVDLLNLYTSKSSPNKGTPISFKDLTAEFDRMLKPLSIQMQAQNNTSTGVGTTLYDTTVDCTHPVLAIEPRNPATPPRSFKIHKQRTVIRPGYTMSEPVLIDLPINPDCVTPQTFENILEIAENMRPLPPRVDNYTHYPPSHFLTRPCYGVPIKPETPFKAPRPAASTPHQGRPSKCSAAGLKL